METTTLKDQYLAYKTQNPKMRIRDIASALGVSEAELLMTEVGENVVILQEPFEELLQQIPSLGYVMALTRNEYCVHERKGIYQNISFTPHAGLVLGADIDLRLFINQWKIGFAVAGNGPRSFQFFDGKGTAVHKIYLTEKSDEQQYHALAEGFRKAEQLAFPINATVAAIRSEKPDMEVDSTAFQAAWLAMRDTHEFFGILKRFGLNRTQALRLAPKGFSKEISIGLFKKVMENCSGQKIPVMVFVANAGCIQIHTGPIQRLVQMGPWFNILDPEFNLHLKEDAIAAVWHVVKPSADGDVNSLELFDNTGELIVQVFGKRKPGQAELSEWRSLLSTKEII